MLPKMGDHRIYLTFLEALNFSKTGELNGLSGKMPAATETTEEVDYFDPQPDLR